ncbi:MAG: terminase small subunit [Gammaproteobacteria bacterium]
MKNLTAKQERFCHAVLSAPSVSEAYRQVYDCSRMNPASVNRAAFELVNNPKITARLEFLRESLNERMEVSDLKLLAESACIAYSDPADAYDANGRLLDVREMPKNFRAALRSFRVFEEYAGAGENRVLVGYTKKITLCDKNQALALLMKHLGMFEKDNSQQCESKSLLAQLPRDQQKLLAQALREMIAEDEARARGMA